LFYNLNFNQVEIMPIYLQLCGLADVMHKQNKVLMTKYDDNLMFRH